jgi:hypothetical protein
MAFDVAMKVIGVVMTSSPGPMSSARDRRRVIHAQVFREFLLEQRRPRAGRQEDAAQCIGDRGDVVLGQRVPVEFNASHQKTFPL